MILETENIKWRFLLIQVQWKYFVYYFNKFELTGNVEIL